jgi:hypothetical protein
MGVRMAEKHRNQGGISPMTDKDETIRKLEALVEARAEALAKSLFGEWAMEATRSYVDRGSRYKALKAKALEKAWAKAFKAWVSNLRDRRLYQESEDLGSELGLRGMELPIHLVKATLKKLPTALPPLDEDPQGQENLTRAIDDTLRKRKSSRVQ